MNGVLAEIRITGHRPAPLRPGRAVERYAGVCAVRVGIARERFEKVFVEADQRAAFDMMMTRKKAVITTSVATPAIIE